MRKNTRSRLSRSVWCWLAGALLLGTPGVASGQGSVAGDRAALEALYDATDGENWNINDGWKTDLPLRGWLRRHH